MTIDITDEYVYWTFSAARSNFFAISEAPKEWNWVIWDIDGTFCLTSCPPATQDTICMKIHFSKPNRLLIFPLKSRKSCLMTLFGSQLRIKMYYRRSCASRKKVTGSILCETLSITNYLSIRNHRSALSQNDTGRVRRSESRETHSSIYFTGVPATAANIGRTNGLLAKEWLSWTVKLIVVSSACRRCEFSDPPWKFIAIHRNCWTHFHGAYKRSTSQISDRRRITSDRRRY